MLTTRRSAGRLMTFALVALATVAACSSAGGGSIAPSADPDTPISTAAPPGGGDVPGAGGGPGVDPGTGATIVEPKPGQLDVRAVPIQTLSATVDGRHVVVTANWTSGVEPCYVLDTIVVDRGDHAFTITLREGHGPEDVACIEIAMLKATKIDLGELEPGTYTITDSQNVAPPIEVVVG